MANKKVVQFVLLTFLISWSVALAAYLFNVAYGSILSLIILALLYMPAPAYAALILQKLVYRETLSPYGWTLKNLSVRWLLITTILFVFFIVLGTFVVIAINSWDIHDDFTDSGFIFPHGVLSNKVEKYPSAECVSWDVKSARRAHGIVCGGGKPAVWIYRRLRGRCGHSVGSNQYISL